MRTVLGVVHNNAYSCSCIWQAEQNKHVTTRDKEKRAPALGDVLWGPRNTGTTEHKDVTKIQRIAPVVMKPKIKKPASPTPSA